MGSGPLYARMSETESSGVAETLPAAPPEPALPEPRSAATASSAREDQTLALSGEALTASMASSSFEDMTPPYPRNPATALNGSGAAATALSVACANASDAGVKPKAASVRAVAAASAVESARACVKFQSSEAARRGRTPAMNSFAVAQAPRVCSDM